MMANHPLSHYTSLVDLRNQLEIIVQNPAAETVVNVPEIVQFARIRERFMNFTLFCEYLWTVTDRLLKGGVAAFIVGIMGNLVSNRITENVSSFLLATFVPALILVLCCKVVIARRKELELISLTDLIVSGEAMDVALRSGEEKLTITLTANTTRQKLLQVVSSAERRKKFRVESDVVISSCIVYQAILESREIDAGFVSELTDIVKEGAELDPHFSLQLGDAIFIKTDLGVECFILPKKAIPVIKPLSLSYSKSIWRFLLGLGGQWTVKGYQLQDTIVSIATSSFRRDLQIQSFSHEVVSDNSENGDEERVLDILHCKEPTSLPVMRYGFENEVYISAWKEVNIRGRTIKVRSDIVDTYSAYCKGVHVAWREIISKLRLRLRNLVTVPRRYSRVEIESAPDLLSKKEDSVQKQTVEFEVQSLQQSRVEIESVPDLLSENEDSLQNQTAEFEVQSLQQNKVKTESTSDLLSENEDSLQKHTAKFERLSDFVYALLPEENPEAVIVFFHGLLLDESEKQHAFWSTWTMKNSNECWPITLLPEYLEQERSKVDEERSESSDPYRIRVLAVTYEGRSELPDFATKASDDFLLSESFINDLVLTDCCMRRKPDPGYVPIFLVGHDLGGILIKNFIVQADSEARLAEGTTKERLESFLANLKAVMFYATPHSGSQAIEDMAKAIPEDTRSKMLKLMSVLGAEMSRVNGEFSTYRARTGSFTTSAVVPVYKTNQKGFDNVMVVEEASARNDVDEFHTVYEDHFEACQPEGLWSNNMTKLGAKIHEVVSEIRESERLLERNRNSQHNHANSDGKVGLRQGIPQLIDHSSFP